MTNCRNCNYQRLEFLDESVERKCVLDRPEISTDGLSVCSKFAYKSTKGTLIQAHKNSRKMGIGSKKFKTLYAEK